MPADAAVLVRMRITSWPSAGSLYAYEDGAFSFSGASDGVYSFTYRPSFNGVEWPEDKIVTLTVGSGVAPHIAVGVLQPASAVITGDAAVTHNHALVAALAAGDTSISAVAARSRLHSAVGALVSGDFTLNASTYVSKLFSALGSLQSGAATISAIAARASGAVGATPSEVWSYEISPGLTAGQALLALYQLIENGHLKVDVKKMNGELMVGDGTAGNKFRSHLV